MSSRSERPRGSPRAPEDAPSHSRLSATRPLDPELASSLVLLAADAIVVRSLDGVVIAWNLAAERMFGYGASEVVGRRLTFLFPPDKAGEEQAVLQRVAAGHVLRNYETVRVRKDGVAIPVSVAASPVRRGDGTIVAVTKIARQVETADRPEAGLRAELEGLKTLVASRARELSAETEARRALERQAAAREALLAEIAHELRGPLHAIQGWTNLLRAGAPAERERAAEVIERNAAAQAVLLDELFDAVRLASGTLAVELQAVDVARLVAEVVESTRPSAADKGIELVEDRRPVPPARADPRRLEQCVRNLLRNSIKFTARGRIVVSTVPRPDAVEIVVADTGRGIDPAVVPQLFERFSQAGVRSEGLGLGLALVRQLVERQGGSVRAESAGPESGATFVLSLPLA